MAVTYKGKYLGNLNVEIEHLDSGAKIQTSAPKDNNGDGSGFSPTDLASSSLAACMMTIMGIVANRDGIDVSGMYFNSEKHMSASPRRIAKIITSFHLPSGLNEEQRQKLEKAAKACPVHKSLHSEVETPFSFLYDI